jgi:hypothetical protein
LTERTVPEPELEHTHGADDRPRRLTVHELAHLADLLARLHAVADEADLEHVEAVSRLVNRALFRRWSTGDVPDRTVDVTTGELL